MGETAEPAAKRRVVLKEGPAGRPYRVPVEQDATGFDLLEAATPDFTDRQRAGVTLWKADGEELDLDGSVPAGVGVDRASAVRMEVAPAAAVVAAPSVLDQLARCVVKPAKEQYGKYLGKADVTLRDRKDALQKLAAAAVRSMEATADNPRHLVVFAGPSGCGKTRAGYEGSAMWLRQDGKDALKKALEGRAAAVQETLRDVTVLTLYIDLNNGLQYHSEIDKLDANVRLGARLAAQAAGVLLGELVHIPQEQLLVDKVLSAVVRGRLRQLQAAGSTARVLLVVHVDEWQLYMAELVKGGVTVEAAVGVVKRMFIALSSFAFSPPGDLQGKFVLLPILSGTPVLGGVRLDLTARMSRVDGPLSPLPEESSLELAVELFMSRGFADDSVREVLGLIPARVGLRDTGGLPRLLVRLCEHAVQSAVSNKARGDEAPLYHVKWAKSAQLAETDLPHAEAVDRALLLLALTGQPVEIKDPCGNPVETGIAKVVRDADQHGLVQLRAVAGPGTLVVYWPRLPGRAAASSGKLLDLG